MMIFSFPCIVVTPISAEDVLISPRAQVYTGVIYAHCSYGNGGVAYVTRGQYTTLRPIQSINYRFSHTLSEASGYIVVADLTDLDGRIYTPYTDTYTHLSTEREVVPSICRFG